MPSTLPLGLSKALRELPALLEDSHYWQRLQAFRRCFSDQQILVVFLEDLQANPQHELDRCYAFLGVGDFINPSSDVQLNSRDEKLYDTRLLRFLRTNRHTGFKLARISLPVQQRIFNALGMRRPFRGPLQWDQDSREQVIATLREDIRAFLGYCNKPADYWPELAGPG